MWVRLVEKKIIIYAAGCAYTAYCLFNINGWVKKPFGYRNLCFNPMDNRRNRGGAVLILKLFAKRKYNFAMPLFLSFASALL